MKARVKLRDSRIFARFLDSRESAPGLTSFAIEICRLIMHEVLLLLLESYSRNFDDSV